MPLDEYNNKWAWLRELIERQDRQDRQDRRRNAQREERSRFVSIEPNTAQSEPTGATQTALVPFEGPSTLANYEANSFAGQHSQDIQGAAPQLQPQYANTMQHSTPNFPEAGQSTMPYTGQLGWNGPMQQVLGPNQYPPDQYFQGHYVPGQYPLAQVSSPQYAPGHYPAGQFPLPAPMHNYTQPHHEQAPAGDSIAVSQSSESHGGAMPTSATQGSCCTGDSVEHQSKGSSPQTDSLDMSALGEMLSAENSNQGEVAVNPENATQVKEHGVSTPATTEGWQDIISNTPQTSIFTYPSTHATAENPMTSDQYARLQASSQWYHQQVPSYALDGITGSAAPSAERMDASGQTHACSCGPSCNCQFCTVHPYNQQSRDIAQELYSNLAQDSAHLGSSSRPQSSYEDVSSSPTAMHPDDVGGQDFPGNAGEAFAMADPYHSSNWFMVEYGVCTNSTDSSQCREHCTCVGCLAHTGHTGEEFFVENANTFPTDDGVA
ncbi:MAG: hypothetical protein Q9224_001243 [Gallowayella concinna]